MEGATLVPIPDDKFNPKEDARVLREAMKGFGTDEKAIVSVLGYRSTKQMKQIEAEYNSEYKGHETLREQLEADLSGNLRNLCLLLLDMPAERDARLLHEAIKGPGTSEDTLIGIICTKTNNELRDIIHTYKKFYAVNLLHDVIDDTSGYFQRLLTACLKADRPEGGPHDERAVKKDADIMTRIQEKTYLDTPEEAFIDILVNRSHEHLRALFKLDWKNIFRTIDSNLDVDSDVKRALETIMIVIQAPEGYVVRELIKAMKRLGTNDDALIRLVVTHCSTDMVQVKEYYFRDYNTHLHKRIEEETSGDYQTLLLALMGEKRM